MSIHRKERRTMPVFRVERNKGYTVMSNHHLRNKDLSLKAKGLLSQMLSLPECEQPLLYGSLPNLLLVIAGLAAIVLRAAVVTAVVRLDAS